MVRAEASHSLTKSVSWPSRRIGSANQLIRNRDEDHPWLEEQQTLEVQSSLVVQHPGRAADDELRHHDDPLRVFVVGELAQVGEERRADVSIRRIVDFQWDLGALDEPCLPERVAFLPAEGEADGPR